MNEQQTEDMLADIARCLELNSDPAFAAARAELAEIVDRYADLLGSQAVGEVLFRVAAKLAMEAGMAPEEFAARTAAIGAGVRLRQMSGQRR